MREFFGRRLQTGNRTTESPADGIAAQAGKGNPEPLRRALARHHRTYGLQFDAHGYGMAASWLFERLGKPRTKVMPKRDAKGDGAHEAVIEDPRHDAVFRMLAQTQLVHQLATNASERRLLGRLFALPYGGNFGEVRRFASLLAGRHPELAWRVQTGISRIREQNRNIGMRLEELGDWGVMPPEAYERAVARGGLLEGGSYARHIFNENMTRQMGTLEVLNMYLGNFVKSQASEAFKRVPGWEIRMYEVRGSAGEVAGRVLSEGKEISRESGAMTLDAIRDFFLKEARFLPRESKLARGRVILSHYPAAPAYTIPTNTKHLSFQTLNPTQVFVRAVGKAHVQILTEKTFHDGKADHPLAGRIAGARSRRSPRTAPFISESDAEALQSLVLDKPTQAHEGLVIPVELLLTGALVKVNDKLFFIHAAQKQET